MTSRRARKRGEKHMRFTAEPSPELMHALEVLLPKERDTIETHAGRAHHADWCAAVKHPDMQLIEAAPDLLAALQGLLAAVQRSVCEGSGPAQEAAHAAIAKATGAPKAGEKR